MAKLRTNILDRTAQTRKRNAEIDWSTEGKLTPEIKRWHRLAEARGDDRHPIEHLLDELYLSANVVAVLGEMASELGDVTQFGVDGRTPHVVYQMWTEERERHARLAGMALKAGVAERKVQLAEQQAMLMAQAIRSILEDLGVGDDPRAPDIIRKHLMEASSLSAAQLMAPSETNPRTFEVDYDQVDEVSAGQHVDNLKEK